MSLDAVHAHSRAVMTAADTCAPFEGTDDCGVVIDAWQRTTSGPVISLTAVPLQEPMERMSAAAPTHFKRNNDDW